VTTSSRNQTPAEYRASVEAAARQRLDEGKQALEALRERELAESEALNLARIRIQTDQMLAKQAEALRDAERKAEMTAIERRIADVDAVKEAQRRQALEEEARQAAEAKRQALQAAASVEQEKASALEVLAARQAEQRQALEQMKEAARTDGSLRWQVRWLSLRLLAPWKAGLLALVVGVVGGYLLNRHSTEGLLAVTASADAPYTDSDRGLQPVLRLERSFDSAPR
jgi:hypothetical protein